jgi:hypothetical protein
MVAARNHGRSARSLTITQYLNKTANLFCFNYLMCTNQTVRQKKKGKKNTQ